MVTQSDLQTDVRRAEAAPENMSADDTKSVPSRMEVSILIAILAFHAALMAWGATRQSPTWDETGHLAAGVAQWKWGRYDLYNVNPPLVRMVGTLPILLMNFDLNWRFGTESDTPDQRNEIKKSLGRQIIQKYGADSMGYFVLTRWMTIPFSLWGGWVCWAWGRELFGSRSGLMAAVLWSFSPSILGNAMLLNTDVPAAAAGVAAAFAFWKWLQAPSGGAMILAGVVLGVALMCKMSTVVLLPAWFLWWGVASVGSPLRKVMGSGIQLTGILVLALLVVNLGYGFAGSLRPLGSYDFYSRSLTKLEGRKLGSVAGNRFRGSLLENVPVPFPQEYVTGIDTQKSYFDAGQSVFLNGTWYNCGFYSYYLYCLLYKWPVGTLLLFAMAATVTVSNPQYRKKGSAEVALLFAGLVLFALASANININKHIRYVLPAFPFFYIWISKVAMSFRTRERAVAATVKICLSAVVIASLWTYPHNLSFFNCVAGGPLQGHRHLAGSAVDWGQDLNFLQEWLNRHPEARPIGIEYFGVYEARDYGFECDRIPAGPSKTPDQRRPAEVGPLPGWYAISVRGVHERGSRYAWFKEFRPLDRAGYSMQIFHISVEQANRARAKLDLPPLPPNAAAPVPHEGS